MLHIIFQDKGIMPDEIYHKPRGVKNFIYASTIFKIEQEEKQNNAPKPNR
jgi:hypothetical protein